ncbi:MAG: glycosyltransferase [Actinomycetota bacterium]
MSDRQRILRVITRLNIGGPARQALLLTKELRPFYETALVTGRPQQGEGELSDPDVSPERISLVRPMSPGDDVRAYRELRRIVGRGFDLVHTHTAKAGTLTRRAAIASKKRPVVVHTFHGHVLDGYFSAPVREIFLRVERRLADRTDALIAVSEHIRDELLELGIGRREQWRVIPLGFDLSPLLEIEGPSGALRASIGVDEGVPFVGVLGRLAPIKDHETLLRAIARVDGVHLAVLGDGDRRQRIEALRAELGLEDRVHMVGWWTDVASAVADLDVVVLTSRNEGTPVSLIEASAAAKPVVSTDVGGVRAVVDDGVTGLLMPAGDVDGICEALDRLLADVDLRAKMGAAGRERVRDRFDKARLLSDIKALYGELLLGR